jgi:ATP-binding cassette subfamily B protein
MTQVHILKEAELFRNLTKKQLEEIAQHAQEKVYELEENIFVHGEEAKNLYVLLEGAVNLKVKAFEGIDLMTSALTKKGDVFGTPSLMAPSLYNVTAKCLKKTRVLAIDAHAVKGIIEEDPKLGLEIMGQLAQIYFARLNETREGITNLFKVFRLQRP